MANRFSDKLLKSTATASATGVTGTSATTSCCTGSGSLREVEEVVTISSTTVGAGVGTASMTAVVPFLIAGDSWTSHPWE